MSNDTRNEWHRWFCDNAQNSSYPDDKWLRKDGIVDLRAYTKACFLAGRKSGLKEIHDILIGFHNAEDEEHQMLYSEQLFELLQQELEFRRTEE